MADINLTMAQQVAEAASEFQEQRTGRRPTAVSTALCGDTLVVTLRGALSPAEQALAQNPEGAVKVQEFHRRLFQNSVNLLWQEITRITGVAVREAAAEIRTASSAVSLAFSDGTMVQVFQLAGAIPVQAWNASEPIERH